MNEYRFTATPNDVTHESAQGYYVRANSLSDAWREFHRRFGASFENHRVRCTLHREVTP